MAHNDKLSQPRAHLQKATTNEDTAGGVGHILRLKATFSDETCMTVRPNSHRNYFPASTNKLQRAAARGFGRLSQRFHASPHIYFPTKLVLIIKVDGQVDCEVKLRSLCYSAHATDAGASETRGWKAANQWALGCRRLLRTATFTCSPETCLLFTQVIQTDGCYTCSRELSAIKTTTTTTTKQKERYSA